MTRVYDPAVLARARAAAAASAYPDFFAPTAEKVVAGRFDGRTAAAGPCELWTGCVDAQGRPRMSYRGRSALARRVRWEQAHGPARHAVVATCGNPLCVALEHLALDRSRRVGRPGSALCPEGHRKTYRGSDGVLRCRECRNAASARRNATEARREWKRDYDRRNAS